MRQAAPEIIPGEASAEPGSDRGAVADFIASHAVELAALARAHQLDTLGYLLEMAKLEAESFARANGRRN
jgi:hypothetical protein